MLSLAEAKPHEGAMPSAYLGEHANGAYRCRAGDAFGLTGGPDKPHRFADCRRSPATLRLFWPVRVPGS